MRVVVSSVLVAAVMTMGSAAREPPFEVVSPEEVCFNYPDPPREGAKDYFTVAEEGQARCVIVHAAGASQRAQYLAKVIGEYLGRVTGAQFRVTPDAAPVPKDMGAIHLGDTAVAIKVPLDLPEVRYGDDIFPNVHGYLVKTVDANTLVIRGATSEALEYGIVGFLERYVGVRQFWMGAPGSLGEVTTARSTLRLPAIEWRDWPFFISRSMSMHPMLPGGSPLPFFRRGTTLPCSENYYRLLPPAKYGSTNPEFFPLVEGSRRVPPPSSYKSRWQPCVSNPEVVRAVAGAVLDYFREHPEAIGLNVSINDGYGDCTCKACRAMDAPGTDYGQRIGMSDRYARFTNQVAEIVAGEFPEKAIVYLAYSATSRPPQTVKLHPNALPVLTVDSAFTAWDQWMQTGARRLGLYLHHNGKTHFVLPKMDLHQTGRRIRYIVASGRARTVKQEMHLHWPVTGAVAYLTSKLLWDPRRDVDDLLDEYCEGLFGPAAPAMRRWHEAMEAGYERWLEETGTPHWFAKDAKATWGAGSSDQFRVLNEAEADRASAALAEAAATPGLNARIVERIALVRAMFLLQEMGVRQYWAAQRLATQPVRSEADARQVVADVRRVIALGRRMAEYIDTTLERPPLDKYRLFQDNRPLTVSYYSLKGGQPSPSCIAAVNTGVRAAAEFLREELGAARAAAWWRQVAEPAGDPMLSSALKTGEMIAAGLTPDNELEDPGYETIGARLAPDERELETDVVLTREELLPKAGVRAWFPDRTPFRALLTRTETHSGAWSLMLEHFHRARLSRGIHAEPQRRYRASVWFKRNAAPGRYSLLVKAYLQGRQGMPPTLATLPVPEEPDQWHELVTDVVAPPDTQRLGIWLQIDGQAKGARCWVDDFFIGPYPDRMFPSSPREFPPDE